MEWKNGLLTVPALILFLIVSVFTGCTTGGGDGGVAYFSVTDGTGGALGTQVAGTPFDIRIEALDSYGNTVTGFEGTVDITDSTGTISPGTSGVFAGGVRTETVQITQADTNIVITVTNSTGTETGTSSGFDVTHAALEGFSVTDRAGAALVMQVVNSPFDIRMEALDVYGNTVTGFDGTVEISNSTGTIAPKTSGAFTAGVRIESVTISLVDTGVVIDVQNSTGTETGSSDAFDVVTTGVSITVDVVNTTGVDLDGYLVHVTSFSWGGDLPEDEIETVDGTIGAITGGEATVVLSRGGSGYGSGTYELRAHIDISNDGLIAAPDDDYITLGEVTVVDADVSVTLDGPWGGYTSFQVNNTATPPGDVTGSETIYLVVVSQGDYWGNYSYSEASALVTSGVIGMDMWGPYGVYDFYAMIDMNGNFATTGAPDEGDYTYSNTGIDWPSDFFPNQTISEWE